MIGGSVVSLGEKVYGKSATFQATVLDSKGGTVRGVYPAPGATYLVTSPSDGGVWGWSANDELSNTDQSTIFDPSTGKPRFTIPGTIWGSAKGSLVVDRRSDGVAVVDRSTGNLLRTLKFPRGVSGTLGEGVALLQANNADAASPAKDEVYALDLGTGLEKWRKPNPGLLGTTIVLDDHYLVVAADGSSTNLQYADGTMTPGPAFGIKPFEGFVDEQGTLATYDASGLLRTRWFCGSTRRRQAGFYDQMPCDGGYMAVSGPSQGSVVIVSLTSGKRVTVAGCGGNLGRYALVAGRFYCTDAALRTLIAFDASSGSEVARSAIQTTVESSKDTSIVSDGRVVAVAVGDSSSRDVGVIFGFEIT